MKKCSKCKLLKDEKAFYKDKSYKDGLRSYCKSCLYIINRLYAVKHSDEINKKKRENYLKKKKTKVCHKSKNGLFKEYYYTFLECEIRKEELLKLGYFDFDILSNYSRGPWKYKLVYKKSL